MVRKAKRLIMGDIDDSRNLGTELSGPINDFCKLAEGMGVAARRVERPEDLNQALTEAFAMGRPNLVEVVIGRYIP